MPKINQSQSPEHSNVVIVVTHLCPKRESETPTKATLECHENLSTPVSGHGIKTICYLFVINCDVFIYFVCPCVCVLVKAVVPTNLGQLGLLVFSLGHQLAGVLSEGANSAHAENQISLKCAEPSLF